MEFQVKKKIISKLFNKIIQNFGYAANDYVSHLIYLFLFEKIFKILNVNDSAQFLFYDIFGLKYYTEEISKFKKYILTSS